MTEERQLSELNKQIDRGNRYRKILDSEPWQYVLNRAADEIDQAVQELKQADPTNQDQIRKLQNTIQRNEDMGRWLREVMDEGDLARELIESNGQIEQ